MIAEIDLRHIDQEWFRNNSKSWKIPCVKAIRSLCGCSLREANDVVTQATETPVQVNIVNIDTNAIKTITDCGGKVRKATIHAKTYLETLRELLCIAVLQEDELMVRRLREIVDFLNALKDEDQEVDTD